jgi:hypothetical protein
MVTAVPQNSRSDKIRSSQKENLIGKSKESMIMDHHGKFWDSFARNITSKSVAPHAYIPKLARRKWGHRKQTGTEIVFRQGGSKRFGLLEDGRGLTMNNRFWMKYILFIGLPANKNRRIVWNYHQIQEPSETTSVMVVNSQWNLQ